MRGKAKRVGILVDRCAEIASQAPNISSYVILYQKKDGSVNYHRAGTISEQVGMLEISRQGIINGLFASEEEND